jgi:hypothetical protein
VTPPGFQTPRSGAVLTVQRVHDEDFQEVVIWFWIGTHAEYDQLLRTL